MCLLSSEIEQNVSKGLQPIYAANQAAKEECKKASLCAAMKCPFVDAARYANGAGVNT